MPRRDEHGGPAVGVMFPADPAVVASWSGIPRALVEALGGWGVQAKQLSVELPRSLELVATGVLGAFRLHRVEPVEGLSRLRASRLAVKEASTEIAALRTWMGRRRLRGDRNLDGIVQIGIGYSLPFAAPIVTFED